MHDWIHQYIERTKQIYDTMPIDRIVDIARLFKTAHDEGRTIFTFGNGANAAHAAHFATDLGKGVTDATGRPFRTISLSDNTSWLTAVGNDYSYDEVFVRQLSNLGRPEDIAFSMSVSGNSPNCVQAFRWAKENGLHTVAIVGAKRGAMAELADITMVLDDTHYGRVEDVQIAICHMLACMFIEGAV